MELDIHPVLEWNWLPSKSFSQSYVIEVGICFHTDKATFSEHKSWGLAIEMTCCNPVLLWA